MATSASRRYAPDDYYQTEMVFNGFDDVQREQVRPRPTPIRTIAYRPEYEPQEKRIDRVQHISEPTTRKQRKCCSKLCLIGLGIGLLIGILIAIAVAVPVGVLTRNQTCDMHQTSSSPNWIGTFQMDGSCETSTCCCYTNTVTFSQTSNNQLQISGSVSGARCSSSLAPVSFTQAMPSGLQTVLVWSPDRIRLQLGQDSSYISFVNIAYGACSASGLRMSYNAGSAAGMNVLLTLFALLLSFVRTLL